MTYHDGVLHGQHRARTLERFAPDPAEPLDRWEGDVVAATRSEVLRRERWSGGVAALESDAGQVDVLVVDDDPATRTSFGSVLRAAGFNTAEAEDGFVALERLRSSSVGAVLLKIDLPGLDGLQLLDRLDNPPPVIFMSTADYGDGLLRRSQKYAFVRKPVSSAHLLAAVSRTLKADRWRRRDLVADTKEPH